MEADLFGQIKFSFISTFIDNSLAEGRGYNFNDPKVKQEFIDNINYIKENCGKLPNFWKIDGKPVIVTWSTHAYRGEVDIIDAFTRVSSNDDVYLIGEIAANLARDERYYPFLKAPLHGVYNYEPVLGSFPPRGTGKHLL